jgi:hypothetical protein
MNKFLIAAFAAVVFTPLFAYAALTETQISSIIQLMRAFDADESAIVGVSAALRGEVLGATAYCPALTTTLQRGMSDATTGGQVTRLQKFLASYYSLNEQDSVTGYFGIATQRTVVRFQTQHGLSPVGVVGAQTRAKIAELCGGVVTPPQPPTTSTNRNIGTMKVRAIVVTLAEVSTKYGSYGMTFTQSKLPETDQALQRLNAFVKQSSYGQAEVQWSTAGVYDIGSGVCAHATYGEKVDDLILRSLQKADLERPIDDYSMYVIVHPMPDCPDGVPWSFEGKAQFTKYTLNGRDVHLRGIHISDLSDFYLFHEFGHTLGYQPNSGIGHPDYMQCPISTTSGVTTVSLSNSCPHVYDFSRGALPVYSVMSGNAGSLSDYSAPEKVIIGWLGGAQVVPTTSGQYVLSALESVGSGPKALKIPISGSDLSAYISFRQPLGYTYPATPPNKPNGVIVDVASSASALSFLATNTNLDAPLTVGMPYRLGTTGPFVTVTGIANNLASITVSSTASSTPVLKPGPICPAIAYMPIECATGGPAPRYDANGCQNGWICTTATSTLPTVTVTTDASSPAFALVPAGTSVPLVAMRLSATGEAVSLNTITVSLAEGVSWDLENVVLYKDGAPKATAYFVGTGTQAVFTLAAPIVIPKGKYVVFTVHGKLSPIGTGQAVTESGHKVRVEFKALTGAGTTSLQSTAVQGGTQSAGVRVTKSFPTVALDSLPTSGVADGRLMRFKIKANESGALGIKDLFVNIGSQDVSISSVQLYGYDDAGYSTPVSSFTASGLLGSGDMTGVSGKDFRFVLPSTLQIPAGTSRYFEVRGVVQPTGPNGLVRATLLGDQNSYPMGVYTSLQGNSFFVWTPNSVTTSALTDSDWINGYSVPGLPGTGLTVVRTAGSTSSPSAITLTAPPAGSTFMVGNPIPITWSFSGAPANSQVLLTLKNIQPSSPISGNLSGGTWQSPIITVTSGTGAYSWLTGASRLDFTGVYQLTAQLKQCDPQGCAYNYSSSYPKYATSNPIQFTLIAATSTPPVLPPVTLPTPVITSFIASPSAITAGQSSTLSWATTGTTDGGCYLYFGGTWLNVTASAFSGFGTYTVAPAASASYKLWCTSSWKDGSPVVEKTVAVTVTQPTSIGGGGDGILRSTQGVLQ